MAYITGGLILRGLVLVCFILKGFSFWGLTLLFFKLWGSYNGYTQCYKLGVYTVRRV